MATRTFQHRRGRRPATRPTAIATGDSAHGRGYPFVLRCREPRRRKPHPEAALILSSVGAEEAAYLTGRVILSAAAEGKKLTATAIAVADAIIEHQQMENLRRARTDVFKGVLRVQAHGVRSLKMKRKIQAVMADCGFDQPFPLAMRIRTGVKAIELFCDATDLFAIESQGQRTKYVRPTEAVHKWLEQQHARCELLEPISLPMIVRPRRWSSPFKGGYITKRPGNRS